MFYWLFDLKKKSKKLYNICYYLILAGISAIVSVVMAIITNIIIDLF